MRALPEDGPWYQINRYRDHVFEAGRYWINADARVYDLSTHRFLTAGHRKSAAERAKRPHQNYFRVQPRNLHGEQVSCLLHVLLWYAAHPDTPWHNTEIDHIDSNSSNNRLSNLVALPWHVHREKTVTLQRAARAANAANADFARFVKDGAPF